MVQQKRKGGREGGRNKYKENKCLQGLGGGNGMPALLARRRSKRFLHLCWERREGCYCGKQINNCNENMERGSEVFYWNARNIAAAWPRGENSNNFCRVGGFFSRKIDHENLFLFLNVSILPWLRYMQMPHRHTNVVTSFSLHLGLTYLCLAY